MKRFRFQLETVLTYKQQALDALMIELSMEQERVARQTSRRNEARQRLETYDIEYVQKKLEGITIVEALEYQTGLEVLEQRLRQEEQELSRAKQRLDAKLQEVVEARKETHVLERLREIRQTEHMKTEQKAEESMLDELTIARWGR